MIPRYRANGKCSDRQSKANVMVMIRCLDCRTPVNIARDNMSDHLWERWTGFKSKFGAAGHAGTATEIRHNSDTTEVLCPECVIDRAIERGYGDDPALAALRRDIAKLAETEPKVPPMAYGADPHHRSHES